MQVELSGLVLLVTNDAGRLKGGIHQGMRRSTHSVIVSVPDGSPVDVEIELVPLAMTLEGTQWTRSYILRVKD